MLPVIEGLRREAPEALLSVDTRKAAVASEAFAAGADVVNDIGAGIDPDMFDVVASARGGDGPDAHAGRAQDDAGGSALRRRRRGRARIPRGAARGGGRGRDRPRPSLRRPRDRVGKNLEHNLALLRSIGSFRELGVPVLAGVSRKRFIGELSGATIPPAASKGPSRPRSGAPRRAWRWCASTTSGPPCAPSASWTRSPGSGRDGRSADRVAPSRRGTRRDQWREFVPLLETRFRVVAPDLPAGDERELDHVRAEIDGERCGVIGHGAGGALAQMLAAEGRGRGDGPARRAARGRCRGRRPRVVRVPGPPAVGRGRRGGAGRGRRGAERCDPDVDARPPAGVRPRLTDEAAATIAPMILEYLRADISSSPTPRPTLTTPITRTTGSCGSARTPATWVDLEEDERTIGSSRKTRRTSAMSPPACSCPASAPRAVTARAPARRTCHSRSSSTSTSRSTRATTRSTRRRTIVRSPTRSARSSSTGRSTSSRRWPTRSHAGSRRSRGSSTVTAVVHKPNAAGRLGIDGVAAAATATGDAAADG